MSELRKEAPQGMISILSKKMDVNTRENNFGVERHCSNEWKPGVEERGMHGLVTDLKKKKKLWELIGFGKRRNIPVFFEEQFTYNIM